MAASSALHRQDGSGDELPNFCHESFIWDCEGGNFSGSACAALEPTGVGSGVLGKCGRGLAPDCSGSVPNPSTDTPSSGASPLPHLDLHISDGPRSAFALLLLWLLILILGAPSNTLAERRLESVGNPAGRRVSRPGPRMAHDGGPRIQAGVRAHRT